MGSFDISDFAPKTDSWWDPAVGDYVVGEVLHVERMIRDNFDRDGKEMQLRIDLRQDDGRTISVYATIRTKVHPETGEPLEGSYVTRKAQAIFDAVRNAGRTSLDTGGRLGIQRVADEPNRKGNGLMAQEFRAEYAPPAAQRVMIPTDTPTAPAVAPMPSMMQQAPAPAPMPSMMAQAPAPAPVQANGQMERHQRIAAAYGMAVEVVAGMAEPQLAALEAGMPAPAPAPAPAAPAANAQAAMASLLGQR